MRGAAWYCAGPWPLKAAYDRALAGPIRPSPWLDKVLGRGHCGGMTNSEYIHEGGHGWPQVVPAPALTCHGRFSVAEATEYQDPIRISAADIQAQADAHLQVFGQALAMAVGAGGAQGYGSVVGPMMPPGAVLVPMPNWQTPCQGCGYYPCRGLTLSCTGVGIKVPELVGPNGYRYLDISAPDGWCASRDGEPFECAVSSGVWYWDSSSEAFEPWGGGMRAEVTTMGPNLPGPCECGLSACVRQGGSGGRHSLDYCPRAGWTE